MSGTRQNVSDLPSFACVIVTYQRHEQLRRTLGLLRSQSVQPARWWIVDNGAPSGASALAARIPNCRYVAMPSNRGPAGGVAAGMQAVIEDADHDAVDYVVLVDDDDPPPTHDTFERLLVLASELRSDPTHGGVGLTGARFDIPRARTRRVPDEELTGIVSVDSIPGGYFPMYSLRAIRSVGVFDDALFFGFEELEFGLRLKRDGWRLRCSGETMHELRRRDGRLGLPERVPGHRVAPWRRYYSSRNLVLITRRYGSAVAVLRAVLRAGLGAAARTLLVHHDPSGSAMALRGAFDGLRGRSGRVVIPRWER